MTCTGSTASSCRLSGKPAGSSHSRILQSLIDATTSLFLFGRADAIRRAVHEELEVNREQIGHAVIAGFGDVGSAAYTEMIASGIACVVVDAKKYEVNEVVGNAESEEILNEARIGGPVLHRRAQR